MNVLRWWFQYHHRSINTLNKVGGRKPLQVIYLHNLFPFRDKIAAIWRLMVFQATPWYLSGITLIQICTVSVVFALLMWWNMCHCLLSLAPRLFNSEPMHFKFYLSVWSAIEQADLFIPFLYISSASCHFASASRL